MNLYKTATQETFELGYLIQIAVYERIYLSIHIFTYLPSYLFTYLPI